LICLSNPPGASIPNFSSLTPQIRDNLTFDIAQVRTSHLPEAAQHFITARLFEEIEKQEQQTAKSQSHTESFKIASKEEVMKLFYEEIELQHEKLFERLAIL